MPKRYFLYGLIAILILLSVFTLIVARPYGSSPISLLLTHHARRDFQWQCQAPSKQKTLTASKSIQWTQLTCHGTYPKQWWHLRPHPTGPLTINIIDADLSDPHVFVKPTVGNVNAVEPYRNKISTLAQTNTNFIAGINGGYFLARDDGSDANCRSRITKGPITSAAQVGDGLLIIDKKPYSTNCNGTLLSEKKRSVLIQDASTKLWYIKNIPANTVPTSVENALGAGPGLIKMRQGKPQIWLTWQGILSSFEFGANTAVILAVDKNEHQHMLLLTVNGHDKIYGMTSMTMANFIYHVVPPLFNLQLASAMSMDQGNSTGMYIKTENPNLVSKTGRNNTMRDIYDALFIGRDA